LINWGDIEYLSVYCVELQMCMNNNSCNVKINTYFSALKINTKWNVKVKTPIFSNYQTIQNLKYAEKRIAKNHVSGH
jgi:hypothetical protein